MKKVLINLLVIAMLLIPFPVRAQVADAWLEIDSVPMNNGSTMLAEARFFVVRGSPLGEIATGTLEWYLERCTLEGCTQIPFGVTPLPYRVTVTLNQLGSIYRLRVHQVELDMTAYTAFRYGPLP